MSRQGTVVVAKIGDAGVLLTPGTHRYVLTYTVANVLRPMREVPQTGCEVDGSLDGSERSVFAWWVVAPQLGDVDRERRHPRHPAQPRHRGDVPSGFRAVADCAVSGAGTRTITITGSSLLPRTGIEAAAYSAAARHTGPSLPWAATWDRYLGTVSWLPFLLLGLSVLAGCHRHRVGALWRPRSRRASRCSTEPPTGLGPGAVRVPHQRDHRHERSPPRCCTSPTAVW